MEDTQSVMTEGGIKREDRECNGAQVKGEHGRTQASRKKRHTHKKKVKGREKGYELVTKLSRKQGAKGKKRGRREKRC